jgi:phosphatidylethanolamine/phosphatidyl-N-methylethanolamine N-methyltransferase
LIGIAVNAQKSPVQKNGTRPKIPLDVHLGDEARFIRSWLENPKIAGAIAPSGRFLARALAQCVNPVAPGPIIELGPGTGPVTQALLARGVPASKLILVEYEKSFCSLLARKFPGVKIVRGDAYRLADTLKGILTERPSAVVSSLPLLTAPEHDRLVLLRQAMELMDDNGRFVQFTYGVKSPVPTHLGDSLHVRIQALAPIWLNIPPARIYIYRRANGPTSFKEPPDVIDEILRKSRRAAQEIRDEFFEARARIVSNGRRR